MKMFTPTTSMLLGASLFLSVFSAPVPVAPTVNKRGTLEARALVAGIYTVPKDGTCFAFGPRYGLTVDDLLAENVYAIPRFVPFISLTSRFSPCGPTLQEGFQVNINAIRQKKGLPPL